MRALSNRSREALGLAQAPVYASGSLPTEQVSGDAAASSQSVAPQSDTLAHVDGSVGDLPTGAVVEAPDGVAIVDGPEPVSRPADEAPGEVDERPSYLARLSLSPEDRGLDLRRLDNLRTLMALVHAGTLRQRRAATLRLGELLQEPRGLPADQVKLALETLTQLRKFDIAYELSVVCAQLPGAEGRRARAARKAWDPLVATVAADVQGFWEGELADEPISALHIDQQVQLLVRTRDLPDELIRHLGAVIEGADGRTELSQRASLVGALLHAGDPRLLPSLRLVLVRGESELVRPAARALARTEDPRVHATLAFAYERTPRADLRLALAGALGMVGDTRGLEYVRQILSQSDSPLLSRALQALDSLGSSEDVQRVIDLLERSEPDILMAAVRTLHRLGDGRVLVPLARLRQETERSALRAEIEETRLAVLSRLELLGEEAPPDDAANELFKTTKRAASVMHRDPAWLRVRAEWSLWVGYLFRLVGAHRKAVGRFEEAATLRPAWVMPVLAMALAFARRGEYALALSRFRRALEINSGYVEQHPTAVRHLAHSFLRRAEAVELDGRHDIAFGLLEEALALDLRRAPSGLRFALSQRHEVLRTRAA